MNTEGISVLIPVYNVGVKDLVLELQKQLVESKINFEICVHDDLSEDKFKLENRDLSKIEKIKYIELPQNVGRSKIRNSLAKDANYAYLLFLDCDVSVINKNYIPNYLPWLNTSDIVSGGTNYAINPPADQSLMLHWSAGSKKEQRTAFKRNQNPYDAFTINNLLIKKDVFLKYQLDETITTYGHEDSLFGYRIMENNVSIIHIDNPVIHEGLNKADDFIEKSITAVENLCYIIREYNIGKDTKLYKAYAIINQSGLSKVFIFIFNLMKNTIYKNLHSKNPNLTLFDLVKLNRMIQFFTYTDTSMTNQHKS